jgi:hypothetical protein
MARANAPTWKSSCIATCYIIRALATSSSTRAATCSGIFGEMMLTYFKGCGGAGLVIDGCVRDFPHVQTLGLGLWLRGVTPNFHAQTNIMPFAVNVPIACGGVTVSLILCIRRLDLECFLPDENRAR